MELGLMESGCSSSCSGTSGGASRLSYDSGLEQMLAAEALGYRSVWIAEHHFNDYGLCPAPPSPGIVRPRPVPPLCVSAWA